MEMQPNDAYMLIKMVNMQARWMIKSLKTQHIKNHSLIYQMEMNSRGRRKKMLLYLFAKLKCVTERS